MKKIIMLFILSFMMAITAKSAGFWNNFDTDPNLSQWMQDRYSPATFEKAMFDGDNRLHIAITQDLADRPAAYQSTFYNTHGRQIQTNVDNPSVLRGKLYIPASWATSHRRSDIWGVLAAANGDVTDYPIIGFANTTGTNPTFRVWDQDLNSASGAWVDVPYIIAYNQWYDLVIEFSATEYKYYINGTLVFTDNTTQTETTQLKSIIVQGYNFGDPALVAEQQSFNDDYDIYWDDIAVYPQGYNVVNITKGTVHSTIQEAVDAATTLDGDIIKVGSGTFNETVNVSKRLTIEGSGNTSTGTIITKTGGSNGAINFLGIRN